MDYINNVDLEYRDLGPGEELYDEVDLSTHDIVDAQYRKIAGYEGIPTICALPNILPLRDVFNRTMYIPPVLEDPDWTGGTEEKLMLSHALRKVRIPLPFQGEIDRIINQLLIASYSCRRLAVTKRTIEYVVGDEQFSTNILSKYEKMTGSVEAKSIYGTPGTGKTSAIGMCLKRYPKVIRHKDFIQVPIVPVTAYVGSNLSALFASFGAYLDSVLDMGNYHWELAIKRSSNLGKITTQIIQWIQTYHIGLLVVDEVQFLDMSTTSQKSIENIVAITENTGIGLLVSGNISALEMWGKNLRLMRRMEGSAIVTTGETVEKDFFDIVITRLWERTIFAKTDKLTDEIKDALYQSSVGLIDLLSFILIGLQDERITKYEPRIDRIQENSDMPVEAKKKQIQSMKSQMKITAKHIKTFVDTHLSRMRSLAQSTIKEDNATYLREREALDKMYAKDLWQEREKTQALTQALQDDIRIGYNHMSSLRMVVKAIQDTDISGMYTKKKIELAFCEAEKTDGFKTMSRREMIRKTLAILRSRQNRKFATQETVNRKTGNIREAMDPQQDMEKIKSFQSDLTPAMGGTV